MRVLQRGHRYELKNRGDSKTGTQVIQYVNREPGMECDGVTQQEVLRMMLDRNRYCTSCLPNAVSERIQYHLRMALVLHEMRALERKVQKGELAPEFIDLGKDGHFRLTQDDNMEIDGDEELNTDILVPYKQEWEKECNHQTVNDKNTEGLVKTLVELKDEEPDEDDDREEPAPKLKGKNPKLILSTRQELKKFLESPGGPDINGKRVDVNGSVTHILRAVRNHSQDDARAAEKYARMLYTLYKKRVTGNQPSWGLNGRKLAEDPYYSGIRARAYVEALELVFDYREVAATFFKGLDKTDKNIITISKPTKLINLSTGDVSDLSRFECEILSRTSGFVNSYVLYRPDNDEEIDITFGKKSPYKVFVGI